MGSIMSGFGLAGLWILLLSGAVLLALLVWRMAGAFRPGEQRPVFVMGTTFEDVLRDRLERGEISEREFAYEMRQLKDS